MDFCSEGNWMQMPPDTGFTTYNGLRITGVIDSIGYGEFDITPERLNPMGIVHGGCLAALADTVAGTAACCAVGKPCVTVNYCFNFLRPALGTGQKIYCRAKPQKVGRTLCVYIATLTDDSGSEVAAGTFTFFHTPDTEEGGGGPPVKGKD